MNSGRPLGAWRRVSHKDSQMIGCEERPGLHTEGGRAHSGPTTETLHLGRGTAQLSAFKPIVETRISAIRFGAAKSPNGETLIIFAALFHSTPCVFMNSPIHPFSLALLSILNHLYFHLLSFNHFPKVDCISLSVFI